MEKREQDQIKQLKNDYFQLERLHYDEKECLIKVIHTLGTLSAGSPEMAEEIQKLKNLISPDGELPLSSIEEGVDRIKEKIIIKEESGAGLEGNLDKVQRLEERLTQAYVSMQKIILPLLEEFYPLTRELEAKAQAVQVNCTQEAGQIEFGETTTAFLDYIKALRDKIAGDFKNISKAFLVFLDQIKGLEETFTREFGGDERIKEMETFELKVSDVANSIENSFNLYGTIDEIKDAVIGKIENIKRLVSLKKKEEIERTHSAQKDIQQLRKRITEVEKGAQKLTKKAEQFQAAALQDGLTGLSNRRAFDSRIAAAVKAFSETGESVAIILFDVDGFKAINDQFGHLAGDKVLKKVGQCLSETFRENDFIARYGGDEFVVVIEKLTKEMAKERLSTFRKNLRKRRFTSYVKGDIAVSVSAGIAMAEAGDTPESLIEKADRAMYMAKQKKK